MSTPVLLAIIGALTFALSNIFVRRAVLKVADPSVGASISILLAVPFFVLVLAIMGDLGGIAAFSWQSWAWLVAAGILHFVFGRSFYYNLIKMVGANLASVINRFSPIFSVFLGITILGEPLSWRLALGVFLILAGLVAITIPPRKSEDLKIFRIPGKAWLIGFLVGIAWGATPVLIKIGLGGSGSPVAGAFISYLGASVVISGSLLNEDNRTNLTSTKGKALLFFCLAGLLSASAQLMRYVALSMGAASVVQPVFSLNPLFLLLLSFLFNRKLESFGPMVVIGILTVVAGTILLA
ncbi:MAG: DMT family transporter [Chloroflexi bacterium]|nr:DMT family transporter [Chloroflexota bacterium]